MHNFAKLFVTLVREEIKDTIEYWIISPRRGEKRALSTPGKRIILILARWPPYSSIPFLIRAGANLLSDRSPKHASPFEKRLSCPFRRAWFTNSLSSAHYPNDSTDSLVILDYLCNPSSSIFYLYWSGYFVVGFLGIAQETGEGTFMGRAVASSLSYQY